jgi:hypothetical protein
LVAFVSGVYIDNGGYAPNSRRNNMRNGSGVTALAAATLLLLGISAAQADAVAPQRDHVIGGGYAAFESNGAPGENSYWVFARERPNGEPSGEWYADVVIHFPGFTWVFKALYSVDCLEVDHLSNTAWIEGTVIDSPDPSNLGVRAFLWLRDGDDVAGVPDQHSITPIAAGSNFNCHDRPAPDFMESISSGNYIIQQRRY